MMVLQSGSVGVKVQIFNCENFREARVFGFGWSGG